MKYQLIVRNISYYAEGSFHMGDIVIENGKIAQILPVGESCGMEALRIIDGSGLTALPGLIDSHVHFREPGKPYREDFFTGSCAAAAGGIATFCEMPNCCPPPNCPANLDTRISLAEEKAVVDFAMFGAAGYGNRDQFKALVDKGVCAFKTFLQPPAIGREEEFDGLTAADDGELYMMLRAGAESGGRFFFHCENADLIAMLEKELHEKGEEGPDFHYRSRDGVAEVQIVEKVIRFAEATGCKIGIVHITMAESCRLVKEAKARGVDVAAETCFQYLAYDDSAIDQWGPWAKSNPPLRSRENVEAMWPYLLDGTIDMIGSDHAPLTVAEKEAGEKQIWKAFSGVPGTEAMVPVMLNQVAEGRLTLEKLACAMSEGAARVHGLAHCKGKIALGMDGDLTILDMNREYSLSIENMYTHARQLNKMFDGLQIKGKPVYTVSRGRVVMEDGIVDTSAKGWGHFIPSVK